MKDNTKTTPMTPERKAEIIQSLGSIMRLTRAVVETIEDLGPTPTDVVYDALVNKGLVDAGCFDRLIQLATATGKVRRDGLVIRPTTKAEQIAHAKKVLAEIAEIQREIESRGL